MPIIQLATFVIRKRDGQYCVLTEDESKVLGCHDTEEGAQAQLRAIEASKAARSSQRLPVRRFVKQDDFAEIKGVELFAPGVHNGARYTERDLDHMLDAFGRAGYKVPLKKGHVPDEGAPALGWLANLRKEAGKLVGDLVDLPEQVYEAIKNRRYGQISLEVWTNLKNAIGEFPRAIKGVSLLGSEIPAVPNLKPAWENIDLSSVTWDEERVFETVHVPNGEKPMTEYLQITRAQMEAICPPCAAKMRKLNYKALKVTRLPDGTFQLPGGMPREAFESLCGHWGPAEGFRTRCMTGEIESVAGDPAAFCNALKTACQDEGLLTLRHPVLTFEVKENEDGRFCAFKDDEMIGCYDTREEAESKLKEAVQMSTQAKNGEPEAPEVKVLRAGLEAATTKIAELTEERRREKTAAKVASLKIPAWRPHVQAIYDALTSPERPKTLKFTFDGKTPQDAAPEAVVDALVADLNAKAERLFGEAATSKFIRAEGDEPKSQADAGAEIHRLAQAMADEKKISYSEAVRRVVADKPELAKLAQL